MEQKIKIDPEEVLRNLKPIFDNLTIDDVKESMNRLFGPALGGIFETGNPDETEAAFLRKQLHIERARVRELTERLQAINKISIHGVPDE